MEKGHARPLATVFGQVTVTRMAYRAPGAGNVHPADTELNLVGDLVGGVGFAAIVNVPSAQFCPPGSPDCVTGCRA